MSGLQNIEIQPDGKTAWFEGGTYDGQVMAYLWDRGYVASRLHTPAYLQPKLVVANIRP